MPSAEMPIYEEKLISPLSIRFTQDYIRTTFRDGRQLETAVNAMKAEPGVEDYDLILRAPFPHIEIIRWRIPRYGVGRIKTSSLESREHWFTLDNRRLYCLQRAAVALWPRRVAAVVEIMYADPGSIWRKYDSSSYGFCVHLGPSSSEPSTDRWDWREKVLPLEMRHDEEPGILGLVLEDDKKRKVGDLRDTPDEARGEAQSLSEVLSSVRAEPRGLAAAASSEDQPKSVAASASSADPCLTPSTAEGSDESDAAAAGGLARAQGSADRPEAEPSNELEALAEMAIAEVEEQLQQPEARGYVWIADWNNRFGKRLGPFRDFLDSRPDRFEVRRTGNRTFKVKSRAAESSKR